jgi:flagellar hook-associated protein 3 FlgL
MRIASLSSFDASVAQLQRRQEAMTTAQEKLTSGKRVMRPSDDPADAARAERALAAESRAIAQQRALDASRNAMQLTESALGDASELMQQARELMVGAGNGSYTDKERKINAQALRGLRDDLLAVANRTDGAGRYLFGGQGSDGQPLLDEPGGVTYTATGGTTQAPQVRPRRCHWTGRPPGCWRPTPATPAPPSRSLTSWTVSPPSWKPPAAPVPKWHKP